LKQKWEHFFLFEFLLASYLNPCKNIEKTVTSKIKNELKKTVNLNIQFDCFYGFVSNLIITELQLLDVKGILYYFSSWKATQLVSKLLRKSLRLSTYQQISLMA